MSSRWPPTVGIVGFDGGHRPAITLAIRPEESKAEAESVGGGAPGACCYPDGTCDVVSEFDCVTAGGEFRGEGTTCDDVECPVTGACCREDICTIESQSDCEGDGGIYQGDGTECDPNPCVCPLEHLNSLSVHIELHINCDCDPEFTNCCDCDFEDCAVVHNDCSAFEADISFDCTWTWAHPAEECQAGFCDCGEPQFDQTDGCAQITDCVGSTLFGISPCDIGLCTPYGVSSAGGTVGFFGLVGPRFGASITLLTACCDHCSVDRSFNTDFIDWGGVPGTYVSTGSGDCGPTGDWEMTATLVAS